MLTSNASSDRALRRALQRARDAARSTGRTRGLVLRRRFSDTSARLPDPFVVLGPREAQAPSGERFCWEDPDAELAVAAEGAALAIECAGPGRFADVASQARRHTAELVWAGDALRPDEPPPPLWLGGFAFGETPSASALWRDFPPARWVVPERAVVRRGRRLESLVAIPVAPHTEIEPAFARLRRAETALAACLAASSPPPARGRRRNGNPHVTRSSPRESADAGHDYRERVEHALGAIRTGALEKLVVARTLRFAMPNDLDTAALLGRLRRSQPGCRLFAIVRGGTSFVGATPERLVRVEADRVAVDALAGTAPRGRDPAEDGRLARSLRESKKEQEEHALVVRALREALEPVCRELRVPEAPSVRRFSSVQHLHTPIAARVAAPRPFALLEIAGRLHPTPAIAGSPRFEALAWLAEHEGLERGWYAGLVGWLDARGEGELAVALRSAWVRDREAFLFAGAGVVAGSDPDAELAETRLKLEAALEALGGTQP